MEVDHDNVRQVVEEDKLSSLPDELIHKILSCSDMKSVVQTCLLSSRWKLLWTSMPCLNFSTDQFGDLQKFDKFVSHVLTHRNHQIEVGSVKLHFRGAVNPGFLKNIASYAFSHNVQDLTVDGSTRNRSSCLPFIFSSQSLKHLTLSCIYLKRWDTTKTRLDFPALTTLNLSYIGLSCDLFSKCVNLKNLTLKCFHGEGPEEVYNIITPRLSNLMLSYGRSLEGINLIAPQLENLTIIDCEIEDLNAPPGISSLYYTSRPCSLGLVEFTNDQFHFLNKVTICLYFYGLPYEEKDACNIINMLQELHSARYLTLNWEVVECLSAHPDLLSQVPSPFSNLICLTIDCSRRKNVAYEVKISTEAKIFLLENSLNATIIMELPEIHSSE